MENINSFTQTFSSMVKFVNDKYDVCPQLKKRAMLTTKRIGALSGLRMEIHEHPQWIDEFLLEQGAMMSSMDRRMVRQWRDYSVGYDFYVMEHLADSSVFWSITDARKLYSVRGIGVPYRDVNRLKPPYGIVTMLYPYQGYIVTDGIDLPNKPFLKRSFREELLAAYHIAKKEFGIIQNLVSPSMENNTGRKSTIVQKPRVPKEMVPKYKEIADIISDCCDDLLDDAYEERFLWFLQKLCRRRPSPLESGSAKNWACGIIIAMYGSDKILSGILPLPAPDPDKFTELVEWFGMTERAVATLAGSVLELQGNTRHQKG